MDCPRGSARKHLPFESLIAQEPAKCLDRAKCIPERDARASRSGPGQRGRGDRVHMDLEQVWAAGGGNCYQTNRPRWRRASPLSGAFSIADSILIGHPCGDDGIDLSRDSLSPSFSLSAFRWFHAPPRIRGPSEGLPSAVSKKGPPARGPTSQPTISLVKTNIAVTRIDS